MLHVLATQLKCITVYYLHMRNFIEYLNKFDRFICILHCCTYSISILYAVVFPSVTYISFETVVNYL